MAANPVTMDWQERSQSWNTGSAARELCPVRTAWGEGGEVTGRVGRDQAQGGRRKTEHFFHSTHSPFTLESSYSSLQTCSFQLGQLYPQGPCGNVWRCFWLSQPVGVTGCYWHLVGEAKDTV